MASVLDASIGGFNPELEGSVCAIGVFDGVHAGHMHLIGLAARRASEDGCHSAIVTFDKDPDEVFRPNELRKLSSNDARIAKLATLPADYVAVVDFTTRLASMGPEEFLSALFGENLPSAIYVGEDFRFGRGAKGDVPMLEEWCSGHGVEIIAVPLLGMDGFDVKSTRIRGLLSEGRLDEANRLLGGMHAVQGKVLHGRGEGTDMGFATANLSIPESQMALADGVYGGYAEFGGERFKAAISVGIPPMFEDRSKDNMEVHVLGFEGDLYGEEMKVEFAKRLRPMMSFPTQEKLVAQVKSDIAWIEENL